VVLLAAGILVACLERVTGEPVPLDEQFYLQAEKAHGDPNKGDGQSDPFSSYEGETVLFSGEILSDNKTTSIDIDFRTPDSSAPGGMKGNGKLLLEEPGVFSIALPKNLGRLEIQAFQDLEADGPSESDPFAQKEYLIEEEDLLELRILLELGTRTQQGPIHKEVPHIDKGSPEEPSRPGDPSQPPPEGGGERVEDALFAKIEGERIILRGMIICDNCELVDLDFFRPDDNFAGGRELLGKIKRKPGKYEVDVPSGFGPLIIEAFVDINSDGPGEGDLMGSFVDNPVEIGGANIDNIDIELAVPEDGKMPRGVPQPPPR
jgi:hypothetical protein